MNVFRIPLNLIVITTFLSIKRLGVSGALALASVVLVCFFFLHLVRSSSLIFLLFRSLSLVIEAWAKALFHSHSDSLCLALSLCLLRAASRARVWKKGEGMNGIMVSCVCFGVFGSRVFG